MTAPTRQEAAAYRSIAPRTIGDLHDAIKGRMAVVADLFWGLSTKTPEEEREPSIIDGWLPPITDNQAARFPFLIVRPSKGVDTVQEGNENAQATFDLIIGTYKNADDGWRDVLDVIQAIRYDLGVAPVIEKTAFEHTGPLTWELLAPVDPLLSTRPQWFGIVTTNWTLPRPRRAEARNPTED